MALIWYHSDVFLAVLFFYIIIKYFSKNLDFIENNSLLFYLETAFLNFLPFISCSIYLFFMCFRKKRKTKEKGKKNMFFNILLKIFFFFVFLYQPCIISSLFSILDCVSFNQQPEGYYIKRCLDEKCFARNHLVWIFTLVVPAMFFYILFVPIFEFQREKNSFFANIYIVFW